MKVIRFDNCYQLVHMPHSFPINSYIYEEENELTLIDAGLSCCYRSISGMIDKIGRPVTRLVITHLHWDHVGNVARLKSLYPDMKIYVPEEDYRIFKERSGKHKDIVFDKGYVPDQLVKDGDYIGSLKVIATPGHTPGSISLYDESQKIMFVGDAIQISGGLAVAGDTRILFPFLGMATSDKDLAVNSARTINGYQIDVMACGHGKILHPSQDRLNSIIERAAKRNL